MKVQEKTSRNMGFKKDPQAPGGGFLDHPNAFPVGGYVCACVCLPRSTSIHMVVKHSVFHSPGLLERRKAW